MEASAAIALTTCLVPLRPSFPKLLGRRVGHLIGVSAITIALAVPFPWFLARLPHYG